MYLYPRSATRRIQRPSGRWIPIVVALIWLLLVGATVMLLRRGLLPALAEVASRAPFRI